MCVCVYFHRLPLLLLMNEDIIERMLVCDEMSKNHSMNKNLIEEEGKIREEGRSI